MRLQLILFAVNTLALGACLVLLATVASPSVPLVLVTVGAGLSAFANFAWLLRRTRPGAEPS